VAIWLTKNDLPVDRGPIIEAIEIGAGKPRMNDVALEFMTSFPKELTEISCRKEEGEDFEFIKA
jgi:hypothetical protein